MVNPFKSRKFVYALFTLIVSLIYVALPSAGLEERQIDMLFDFLPIIGAAVVLLFGGHIALDWKTTKAGVQIKEPDVALRDFIEEVIVTWVHKGSPGGQVPSVPGVGGDGGDTAADA